MKSAHRERFTKIGTMREKQWSDPGTTRGRGTKCRYQPNSISTQFCGILIRSSFMSIAGTEMLTWTFEGLSQCCRRFH